MEQKIRSNMYIDSLRYPDGHPMRKSSYVLTIQFDMDIIKTDGVIRWKATGKVPQLDMLEFWKHIGKRFNMAKTLAAYKQDVKVYQDEYRARMQQPTRKMSREEMFERRMS